MYAAPTFKNCTSICNECNIYVTYVIAHLSCISSSQQIRLHTTTQFRGGLIFKIFELIGPPRPNKDNPTPCPYIPMQCCNGQNRGATAFGRGPPVVSIILEYMGMVLDCPCLALEPQLIQNLSHKPLTKFGISKASCEREAASIMIIQTTLYKQHYTNHDHTNNIIAAAQKKTQTLTNAGLWSLSNL